MGINFLISVMLIYLLLYIKSKRKHYKLYGSSMSSVELNELNADTYIKLMVTLYIIVMEFLTILPKEYLEITKQLKTYESILGIYNLIMIVIYFLLLFRLLIKYNKALNGEDVKIYRMFSTQEEIKNKKDN